jgi:hypothetical protein
MGERSTYAMIPVELFDLLYMEDGRSFAAFPRFFAVDQNRISILLVYLYSIVAIDFIFLLGAYFAKTSFLVIYLVLWACIFLNSIAIYQQFSQDRVVLLDFVVP